MLFCVPIFHIIPNTQADAVLLSFQSSVPTFRAGYHPSPDVVGIGTQHLEGAYVRPSGIVSCLKHMVKTEGMWSLFRGLGANVAGFAPSRAIFFATYSKAKVVFNQSGFVQPDGKLVHMLSSCSAGKMEFKCLQQVPGVRGA